MGNWGGRCSMALVLIVSSCVSVSAVKSAVYQACYGYVLEAIVWMGVCIHVLFEFIFAGLSKS